MGLSLRGTTSGAIDINPPAVAGDNAITLPASNGSANQFFKNSGTAGIVTYSSMVENDGRVLIGTDTPRVVSTTVNPHLQIEGTTFHKSALSIVRNSNDSSGCYLILGKSRATSNGGNSILSDGDTIGEVRWTGSDGVDLANVAATIRVNVDGSISENDTPATMSFRVNSGSTGTGERLKLTADNSAVFNGTSYTANPNYNQIICGRTDTANTGITIVNNGSGDTTLAFAQPGDTGRGRLIYNHTNNSFAIKVNGTTTDDRFHISSAGNIGIGTDNPSYLLDVKTTGNQIGRFETTSTADLAIQLKNSQGSMFFGLGGGEEFAVASTSNLNGASDNLFAIKQDGKVGINQISPAAQLHVSGGNIRVDSGYGIDFAATTDSSGTMSSEVLDDYEEGTWTPEYKTSSGGSSGISHYVQNGTYVKIGKLVYIELLIATSDWSSGVSGDIEIQNLPFAMKDTSGAAFNIAFRREWNSNIGENLLGRLTNISDVPSVIFYKNASNSSGTTRVVHTDFMDGSHENYIYGAGWYQVP